MVALRVALDLLVLAILPADRQDRIAAQGALELIGGISAKHKPVREYNDKEARPEQVQAVCEAERVPEMCYAKWQNVTSCAPLLRALELDKKVVVGLKTNLEHKKEIYLHNVEGDWGCGTVGRSLSDVGAKIIAKYIEGSKFPKYLSLKRNAIGDPGAQALAEAIGSCEDKTCDSIGILGLSHNNIGDSGAEALAKAIEKRCKNSPITTLSHKHLHDDDYTLLDLSHNLIGDAGAQALAEAIERCPNMMALDVSKNQIGDSGAIAIVGSIVKREKFHSLRISGNRIGDDGAKTLADMLTEIFVVELWTARRHKERPSATDIAEAIKFDGDGIEVRALGRQERRSEASSPRSGVGAPYSMSPLGPFLCVWTPFSIGLSA